MINYIVLFTCCYHAIIKITNCERGLRNITTSCFAILTFSFFFFDYSNQEWHNIQVTKKRSVPKYFCLKFINLILSLCFFFFLNAK